MNKEDLRVYGDQELSLRIFNDESLYLERHKSGFWNTLDSLFVYNSIQESIEATDLEDDED